MNDPEVNRAPFEQGLAAMPSMGSLENFALLGSSTVTCTNSSAISGDVGVSPGIALTGFDASCTVSGALHAQDAAADAAHADLVSAFDILSSTICEQDLTGVELGGLTLPPGVYCFDTTAGLTDALTLDAAGDASAAWIFQVGSALTTATGSSMAMLGGGDACNVFWNVGTSATLGTGSSFKGNILASASITLTSGSSLEGRALAVNAAVTSDNNAVTGCGR
jgi:type VI secretion system secreted protein VgrG